MQPEKFSKHYPARKLNNADIPEILKLCRANTLYYEYCPPAATKESIREDMNTLPPGTAKDNKYYAGYFDDDKLIAVLDIVEGYPNDKTAFIGFFMTNVSYQKKGVASGIISELIAYLKNEGFTSVRLAWAAENKQAEHFWRKNGFKALYETSSNACDKVILAEKILS